MTCDPRPTVCVVDDDPSVLKSLKRLLGSTGHTVKAFESAREFLDSTIESDGPSCLVLDVMMPEMSGLDLQKEIISREYSMPIIFITALHDIPSSVSAMKKGAVDFLTKPFEEKELLEAIQTALAKDRKKRLERDEIEKIKQRLALLTAREHEVLSYIIAGHLNKQVAFNLDISERTVKAHRSQIMHKMSANSLAELVRLSERAGIQPTDINGG
jgi:FixJ family two-component response regulator